MLWVGISSKRKEGIGGLTFKHPLLVVIALKYGTTVAEAPTEKWWGGDLYRKGFAMGSLSHSLIAHLILSGRLIPVYGLSLYHNLRLL